MTTFVSISQAKDLTATLIAAPASPQRIRVLNYVVVADSGGSFSWTDGVTTWGPFTISGGGSGENPSGMGKGTAVIECGAGLPLRLVTVDSAYNGHLAAEVY